MYRYLCTQMPRPLAEIICALWYATLIVLILSFADRPVADLAYLRQ